MGFLAITWSITAATPITIPVHIAYATDGGISSIDMVRRTTLLILNTRYKSKGEIVLNVAGEKNGRDLNSFQMPFRMRFILYNHAS